MKTLYSIGVIIVLAAFMFLNYEFIIPHILTIFDEGIKNIPTGRYYFGDVLKYNKGIGILGIILELAVAVIMILFAQRTTKWVNKRN